VEYISSLDATIMGSRNGHAPLFLNSCIKKKGMNGFREDIYQCLYRAHWFTNLMTSKGVKAWINHYSITVIFPRPSDSLIKKWAIATENEISHVIVMPHVSKKLLYEFLEEYLIDMENYNFQKEEQLSITNNVIDNNTIFSNDNTFFNKVSTVAITLFSFFYFSFLKKKYTNVI